MTISEPMAPMPIRAVLFDLDGVLVESRRVWIHVLNAVARELQFPTITREQFDRVWGQGTAEDVKCFYPGRTVAEIERAYAAHFQQHAEHLLIDPDAAEAFRKLRLQRVAIAVITNSPRGVALAMLGAAKVAPDVLVAADEVAAPKPAPDLVLRACEMLHLKPAETVVVGDSRYDREAAASAGARFAGFGIDGEWRLIHLTEILDVIAGPH